jgi:hypothetical protein
MVLRALGEGAGMTKAAEVSIEFDLFLEVDDVFASVR